MLHVPHRSDVTLHDNGCGIVATSHVHLGAALCEL